MNTAVKYFAGLILTFLSVAASYAQEAIHITGQKEDHSPVTENSTIRYKDLCRFSLAVSSGTGLKEANWYIRIHLTNSAGDKTSIHYAPSGDMGDRAYNICFSELFGSVGEPQLLIGFHWNKKEKTNLIYADIVCEATTTDNQSVEAILPVYLYLAPDKPILEILRLEETQFEDNYIIEFRVHESPTSAPKDGKWWAHFSLEGISTTIILDTDYYYDDNPVFENDENYFYVYARNKYGTTGSDYIYPRTYASLIEANRIDNEIYIYPNPVQNTLYLHTKGGENNTTGIVVFDTTGKIMKEQSIDKTPNPSVDVSNLSPGHYMLQTHDRNRTKQTFRFLKIQ